MLFVNVASLNLASSHGQELGWHYVLSIRCFHNQQQVVVFAACLSERLDIVDQLYALNCVHEGDVNLEELPPLFECFCFPVEFVDTRPGIGSTQRWADRRF